MVTLAGLEPTTSPAPVNKDALSPFELQRHRDLHYRLLPPLRGIISNLRNWSGIVKPKRFFVLRPCSGGDRDILVCLMSDGRRFPPPWSVEKFDAYFVVMDTAQ